MFKGVFTLIKTIDKNYNRNNKKNNQLDVLRLNS